MRKKRIAIGFIGILSLIVLLFLITLFNPYDLNSTFNFASKHFYPSIILLTIFRASAFVFPAIPAGMITFALIPIFGWFTTFVCNTIGILLGTSVAFLLAKKYKEPLVTRFATLSKINETAKQISGKKQFAALIAFRLFTVPVVDISSYVVGLTQISYKKFISATFIASFPTIFAFYFGEEIYKRIFGRNLFVGIIAILIIGSIYFIIKRYGFKVKS